MNKWYVYFDNEYRMISVTNELSKTNFDYFEIDEELALEFTSGRKSLSSYTVKITNLNQFTLESLFKPVDNSDKFVDSRENNELVFKDIVVVQEAIEHPNLVITHSTHRWIFSLSQELKDSIPENQHDKTLKFFVVKKHELNFLYRKIDIRIKDLIIQDQIIDFISDNEHYYDQICVVAKTTIDKILILKDE